jgi:tetratricopeptide (TPR) repeat protein
MAGDRAAEVFATSEALAHYAAALDGLGQSDANVRVDRSVILEHQGDALEAAGRSREAGDAYFTSLSEWIARGTARRPRFVDSDLQAAARESLICRKMSVSYERRSDYEQALSWIDEALRRLPRRGLAVAAEVMASKSVTLFRRGLYGEAVEWGLRAVSLARRSRNSLVAAYAHNMLANSYIEQGNLKQAVRHLEPSVSLYRDAGDLRGQSSAGNNLASCEQLLGNLDEALAHYQTALRADEQLGNIAHAAIIHNNIGEVLLARGDTTGAREHLQHVMSAFTTQPGLAALTGLAEINLSRCDLADGELDGAESHARRGIRLLKGVGAQGLLDEADLQLAEVTIARGRAAAGARRAREAITRARASGAKLIEARGLRLLGVAMGMEGEGAQAHDALRESAALAREIDAGIEEAKALLDLVRLGDRSPASVRRRSLNRAEALARRSGALPELAQIRMLAERL